jgi:aryl-alcohol dehydrogenase-like predicted oxidoreductase
LVDAEGRMIAWVLSRGDDIVLLIDARTRERLAVALVAWQTELEPDALAAIGGRPGRGGGR